MILIDSSVWVDYLKGNLTLQTSFLRQYWGDKCFITADLIVTEVLQGYKADKDFQHAKQILLSLPLNVIGGEGVAVAAADNYRYLRKKGITVRGTIDVLIATFCLENRLALLYADRDFDVMVKHLGLQSAVDYD